MVLNFLVLGLNPNNELKLVNHDKYTNPINNNFQPSIICEHNSTNIKYDDTIVSLCCPYGIKLKLFIKEKIFNIKSKTRIEGASHFHPFILTQEDGIQFYGYALSYYKKIINPLILESFSKLNTLHMAQLSRSIIQRSLNHPNRDSEPISILSDNNVEASKEYGNPVPLDFYRCTFIDDNSTTENNEYVTTPQQNIISNEPNILTESNNNNSKKDRNMFMSQNNTTTSNVLTQSISVSNPKSVSWSFSLPHIRENKTPFTVKPPDLLDSLTSQFNYAMDSLHITDKLYDMNNDVIYDEKIHDIYATETMCIITDSFYTQIYRQLLDTMFQLLVTLDTMYSNSIDMVQFKQIVLNFIKDEINPNETITRDFEKKSPNILCMGWKAHIISQFIRKITHFQQETSFKNLYSNSDIKTEYSLYYRFLTININDFWAKAPENNDCSILKAKIHNVLHKDLPIFQYDIAWVLGIFDNIDLFLYIMVYLLLEKQLLIVSKDGEKLVAFCETLRCLIYPFEYNHVYVPLLPLSLINFIQAPVPFCMGLLLQSTTIASSYNCNEDVSKKDFNVAAHSSVLSYLEGMYHPFFYANLDTGQIFFPNSFVMEPAGNDMRTDNNSSTNESWKQPNFSLQKNAGSYQKYSSSQTTNWSTLDNSCRFELHLPNHNALAKNVLQILTNLPKPALDNKNLPCMLAIQTAVNFMIRSIFVYHFAQCFRNLPNFLLGHPVKSSVFKPVQLQSYSEGLLSNELSSNIDFSFSQLNASKENISPLTYDNKLGMEKQENSSVVIRPITVPASDMLFDKEAFLLEQSVENQPFYSALFETQLFTTFLNKFYLYQQDGNSENYLSFFMKMMKLCHQETNSPFHSPAIDQSLISHHIMENIDFSKFSSLHMLLSNQQLLEPVVLRRYLSNFLEKMDVSIFNNDKIIASAEAFKNVITINICEKDFIHSVKSSIKNQQYQLSETNIPIDFILINELIIGNSISHQADQIEEGQINTNLNVVTNKIQIPTNSQKVDNVEHIPVLSPTQISNAHWKFVGALLHETKIRTKRMLKEKLCKEHKYNDKLINDKLCDLNLKTYNIDNSYKEISQLAQNNDLIDSFTSDFPGFVAENTLIGMFCDLLCRVWSHGYKFNSNYYYHAMIPTSATNSKTSPKTKNISKETSPRKNHSLYRSCALLHHLLRHIPHSPTKLFNQSQLSNTSVDVKTNKLTNANFLIPDNIDSVVSKVLAKNDTEKIPHNISTKKASYRFKFETVASNDTHTTLSPILDEDETNTDFLHPNHKYKHNDQKCKESNGPTLLTSTPLNPQHNINGEKNCINKNPEKGKFQKSTFSLKIPKRKDEINNTNTKLFKPTGSLKINDHHMIKPENEKSHVKLNHKDEGQKLKKAETLSTTSKQMPFVTNFFNLISKSIWPKELYVRDVLQSSLLQQSQLPTTLIYDLENILKHKIVRDITKSPIGFLRCWIKLQLERQTLYDGFKELLDKSNHQNDKYIRKYYKRYAFIRCADECEQFLHYIQTLGTVDYFCFTNTYINIEIPYKMVFCPIKPITFYTVFKLPSFTLMGHLKKTPILLPSENSLEFEFKHQNLGVLQAIYLSYSNKASSPTDTPMNIKAIYVRNELTGRIFKFDNIFNAGQMKIPGNRKDGSQNIASPLDFCVFLSELLPYNFDLAKDIRTLYDTISENSKIKSHDVLNEKVDNSTNLNTELTLTQIYDQQMILLEQYQVCLTALREKIGFLAKFKGNNPNEYDVNIKNLNTQIIILICNPNDGLLSYMERFFMAYRRYPSSKFFDSSKDENLWTFLGYVNDFLRKLLCFHSQGWDDVTIRNINSILALFSKIQKTFCLKGSAINFAPNHNITNAHIIKGEVIHNNRNGTKYKAINDADHFCQIDESCSNVNNITSIDMVRAFIIQLFRFHLLHHYVRLLAQTPLCVSVYEDYAYFRNQKTLNQIYGSLEKFDDIKLEFVPINLFVI